MMRLTKRLGLFGVVALIMTISTLFLNPAPSMEDAIEGWDFNRSRETSQYILGHNLSAHLPDNFCDHDTLLLVIVCSAPANFEARSAIRETWGQQRYFSGNNLSLFFLLGDVVNDTMQEDLMAESDKFNDIVQERFIDSYNNLTLKSVSMLKLVSTHCSNTTRFLFKIDDDMYVNMHLVVDMLATRYNATTAGLLLGKKICGARPIRDPTSKWYCPNYMYQGRVYPNYVSGTGYIMSIDVVAPLYQAALATPVFHLEDVYVTGMCAAIARIRPRNDDAFTYQKLAPDACAQAHLYTVHRVSPAEMRQTRVALRNDSLARECALQAAKVAFRPANWIMGSFGRGAGKKGGRSKCD